ncbi:MAG TPA: hypothetical protein VII00_09500 [bacterium]
MKNLLKRKELSVLLVLLVSIWGCEKYQPTSAVATGPWTFAGSVPINVIGATGGNPTGVANVRCCWTSPATVTFSNNNCNPANTTIGGYTAYHCINDPATTNKIPCAALGASLPLPGWAGNIPQPFSITIIAYWPDAQTQGLADTICEGLANQLPATPNNYAIPAPVTPTPQPIDCP